MFKKFVKFLRWCLMNRYARCYHNMEDHGYAADEHCEGLFGGTEATDYVREDCLSCPYLGPTERKEN